MTNKNKHETLNPAEKLASELSFAVMSVAAVISLLELPDVRAAKLAPAVNSGFVALTENVENKVEQMMRREKEETAHGVVSYGQTMRSHPVAGKA